MSLRVPLLFSPLLLLAAGCVGHGPGIDTSGGDSEAVQQLKTVFVVVMENHNWSDIEASISAPYLHQTLLPESSYALNYKGPGPHPSEPNYLWLEAGDNFGIHNDKEPSDNHQSTTDHLVTQLEAAGHTWKSYQQGIDGTTCPLTHQGDYYPKHNPMIYFDDVTDGLDPNSTRCIEHERPLTELDTDLTNDTVADYNFIIPD